jgi:1,4-alpha-glucan branching enzyme
MVTKHISAEDPERVEVTFSVPASIWADQVHLVGDFNRWDKTATPMRSSEAGWSATLLLERERPVGYGYLLDGQTWMCDSNADAYEREDGGKVISVLRA